MDEFGFISQLLSPLSTGAAGSYGLTDDAASLAVPAGSELILTKDALVRGIHFIGNESPERIAQKALRVNLSDCAAMGAKPHAYLLALMLPSDITEDWLHSFVEGLKTDQHNFDIVLLGGDTTRTLGELAISVTMLGFVPSGKTLRRNGAKPGDDIYVSGTIGDAALGLPIAQTPLNHESRITNHHFLNRYQLPEPRIVLGQHLRSIATSCMDISDGLAQDLGHICKASGVGAVIEWEKVPLSAAARECNPSPEAILAGGDDYELLFTVPHDQLQAITMLAKEIPITHIGRVVAGHGVQVMGGNGEILALSQTGFRHF